MFLSYQHRIQSAIFYCTCFIIYYGFYYFHGLLLHQLHPVFFLNRLDLSLNILLLSNLQHTVLDNYGIQLLLDIVYLTLPLLFVFSCIRNNKTQYVLAVVIAVFNCVYGLLLSSMSALSIEGFTGWIILPLVFSFKKDKSFYYALHSMRYIFLLIFASAALWKIRTGALFNVEEMSAILLQQHTVYLVQLPQHWFSRLISYLVTHQWLSYTLYLFATLGELSFLTGFFTKKYDRILIAVFFAFALLDYFLMEINYFAWTAFLGCLWFSSLKEPADSTTTN